MIVDYACAEEKLVIEIDGDSHAEPDQAGYDMARCDWLKEYGYRVVRFAAQQVEDGLTRVVERIRGACEEGMERHG